MSSRRIEMIAAVMLVVAGCDRTRANDAHAHKAAHEPGYVPREPAPAPAPAPTPAPAPAPAPVPAPEPPLPPEPEEVIVDAPELPLIRHLSADIGSTSKDLRLQEEGEILDITYPIVQLRDPALRDDLAVRMHEAVLALAKDAKEGNCSATLATAELVSVQCAIYTFGGRDGTHITKYAAIAFRLGPLGARPETIEQAFVDDAELAPLACKKVPRREADDCTAYIALERGGLVAEVFERTDENDNLQFKTVRIPYRAIAAKIRGDGLLAFAARKPAAAPPAPTERLVAFGAPVGPATLASRLRRLKVASNDFTIHDAGHGRYWLALDGIHALPDDGPIAPAALARATQVPTATLAAVARAFGAPAVLTASTRTLARAEVSTRRAVSILAAPRGAVRAKLTEGAELLQLTGIVEGRETHATELRGLWCYAVASLEAYGWVPCADLQ